MKASPKVSTKRATEAELNGESKLNSIKAEEWKIFHEKNASEAISDK